MAELTNQDKEFIHSEAERIVKEFIGVKLLENDPRLKAFSEFWVNDIQRDLTNVFIEYQENFQ